MDNKKLTAIHRFEFIFTILFTLFILVFPSVVQPNPCISLAINGEVLHKPVHGVCLHILKALFTSSFSPLKFRNVFSVLQVVISTGCKKNDERRACTFRIPLEKLPPLRKIPARQHPSYSIRQQPAKINGSDLKHPITRRYDQQRTP